ncbi:hypothetical protein MC885_008164 [Smutsia gigantea]|nr:hypothetical protein MC885_008164 [Smutsia gigantea]
MHPSFLLTILYLGIASAAPHVDVGLNALWSQWMATHGKLSGKDEEVGRRAVWENMKMIDKHNQEYNLEKHSFTMAMHAFGDMTNEEFKQDSEQSYPYHGKNETCKYKPEYSAANVAGYHRIPGQEKDLGVTVANVGPISVAIDANWDTFQFYKEGIYYDPKGSSKALDHEVLVVGYGFEGAESDDNKYWIVKNIWGPGWGMNGYIKMARDQNNLVELPPGPAILLCEMMVTMKDLVENRVSLAGILS